MKLNGNVRTEKIKHRLGVILKKNEIETNLIVNIFSK